MKTRRLRMLALVVVAAALAAGVLATTGSGQTSPSDAISASRFSLTIDGYEIATFNKLLGISSEAEASEYWETSGDNVTVNKLPGKFKPPSITLKRSANGSLELWSWHESVRTGQMNAARRSASLTMFNSEGKPVAKYWLEKAWPSKVELVGVKAGSTNALVETVTLTAEYIQRVAP